MGMFLVTLKALHVGELLLFLMSSQRCPMTEQVLFGSAEFPITGGN